MSGLIRALIDVAALRANLAALRVAARGAKVMAVVKANAYGHGIAQVTAALELADAFAVARIEEAVALRQAGVLAHDGFGPRAFAALDGVQHLAVLVGCHLRATDPGDSVRQCGIGVLQVDPVHRDHEAPDHAHGQV